MIILKYTKICLLILIIVFMLFSIFFTEKKEKLITNSGSISNRIIKSSNHCINGYKYHIISTSRSDTVIQNLTNDGKPIKCLD